jgi:hypothetical protein
MRTRWCEKCGRKFNKGKHAHAFFPYGGKHGRLGRQYICKRCRTKGWSFNSAGKIVLRDLVQYPGQLHAAQN